MYTEITREEDTVSTAGNTPPVSTATSARWATSARRESTGPMLCLVNVGGLPYPLVKMAFLACRCDPSKHTGACTEGTGKCECQPRFEGEDCDRCAKGYYAPPECKKCECMVDGTVGEECLPTDGQCPCKEGFSGVFCETCAPGFTNVTAGCVGCQCDDVGAEHKNCSAETGQCVCKSAYSGLACDQCQLGYFGFPNCTCESPAPACRLQ